MLTGELILPLFFLFGYFHQVLTKDNASISVRSCSLVIKWVKAAGMSHRSNYPQE